MSPVNLQGQPRATLFGSFDEIQAVRPRHQPGGSQIQNNGHERRQELVPDGSPHRPARKSLHRAPLAARKTSQGRSRRRRDPSTRPRRRRAGLAGGHPGVVAPSNSGEHPDIPLIDLFNSILSGETVPAQKAKFGGRAVELGRKDDRSGSGGLREVDGKLGVDAVA